MPQHSPEPSRRAAANALRFLAIDAVEAAKSGHPGAPMGMADIAEVLWRRFLKHNPANPRWPDRDRFVLSNGHASMLLYALLHLSGYDLPLDELRRFRRLGSRTPGHPEAGLTPGVETTTGPLGQGFANAVGMALAEKLLGERFNRPGLSVVDHRTWVFAGDGCLMEGVSHEAASLAGVLGLGKLVCFYDANGISIDGRVEGWFRDDTPARFRAYGWNVVGPIDGHDPDAIDAAIRQALRVPERPSLIVCETTIGWGAPRLAGSHEAHGAPLGTAEAASTRAALDWPHAPFDVPPALRRAWDARAAGAAAEASWRERFETYAAAHPADAAELERRGRGALPPCWPAVVARLAAGANDAKAPAATRKSSQLVLETLVEALPELLGGSADLSGSNLTLTKSSTPLRNYLHYGVREFGMAAVMNGLALHGGFIPYGGTFAVFSDYARSAIRMSALMRQRVVYVLTHDSIGLGEDGPTHQPVEHATMLRTTPNLDVWRPCDAVETAAAWRAAIERASGPTAMLLSRQDVRPSGATEIAKALYGGYILSEAPSRPDVVLIATGSEVGLALEAQKRLASDGIGARVVSMPSTNVFDRQDAAWKAHVLPPGIPRVAIEAAHPDFWRKYVGMEGAVVGIATFGESAPAADLFAHFGVTAENVVLAAMRLLRRPARLASPLPLARPFHHSSSG
jgi:transketolase